MNKVCNICFIEKSIGEFYKNARMSDGYQNICISCTKLKTKERYDIIKSDSSLYSIEKGRQREKYHRLGYKDKYKPTPEREKKIMARYFEKYPEKRFAHIASDHIKNPIGLQKHHWSYKKDHYLDVIFISEKDHNTAHRFMVYDQERMMFRTLTGELLDTKEPHEIYIKNILEKQ